MGRPIQCILKIYKRYKLLISSVQLNPYPILVI